MNDLDRLMFRRQLALHAVIQMQVKGAQTEIGRALSSFRIPVGPAGLYAKKLQDLLREFGGAEATDKLADRYLRIASRTGRNAFAFGAWHTRAFDAAFEVWINGLLSGPATHLRNTIGNTTKPRKS